MTYVLYGANKCPVLRLRCVAGVSSRVSGRMFDVVSQSATAGICPGRSPCGLCSRYYNRIRFCKTNRRGNNRILRYKTAARRLWPIRFLSPRRAAPGGPVARALPCPARPAVTCHTVLSSKLDVDDPDESITQIREPQSLACGPVPPAVCPCPPLSCADLDG